MYISNGANENVTCIMLVIIFLEYVIIINNI